jgi:hypothetical protein
MFGYKQKGRTTNFFSLSSFVAVFGSEIWDKHPGSAILISISHCMVWSIDSPYTRVTKLNSSGLFFIYDMLIVELKEHKPLGLSYIGKKLGLVSESMSNSALLPQNQRNRYEALSTVFLITTIEATFSSMADAILVPCRW